MTEIQYYKELIRLYQESSSIANRMLQYYQKGILSKIWCNIFGEPIFELLSRAIELKSIIIHFESIKIDIVEKVK